MSLEKLWWNEHSVELTSVLTKYIGQEIGFVPLSNLISINGLDEAKLHSMFIEAGVKARLDKDDGLAIYLQ